MNLVRQLLIEIEHETKWPSGKYVASEDASKSYHLHLLIQAGLIEGEEIQALRSAPPRFVITGLTWHGPEFLAASADQNRWSRFKKSAGTTFSSIPLPVITKLLTDGIESSVRSALDDHGFMS